MIKEKQIEEMAKIICTPTANCDKCGFKRHCSKFDDVTDLYNAGYRKASDVAREIFDDVGELINEYLDGRSYRHEFLTKIAELKKKYAEGEK